MRRMKMIVMRHSRNCTTRAASRQRKRVCEWTSALPRPSPPGAAHTPARCGARTEYDDVPYRIVVADERYESSHDDSSVEP